MTIPPRDPVRRIQRCCPAHPRRYPLTRARKNTHRNRLCDALPILPQMKLRQIIRAHEPDKPLLGVKLLQGPQRLRGITRAKPLFDPRHGHTRMIHHFAGLRYPRLHRRRAALLERITRAHQPPHLIQPKPFERLTRDVRMPRMRRIKRPAQQSDHLTRGRIWNVIAQNVTNSVVSQGVKGRYAPPFVNQSCSAQRPDTTPPVDNYRRARYCSENSDTLEESHHGRISIRLSHARGLQDLSWR